MVHENLVDSILESILECILELPVKTSHYATLIGLLSLSRPDFGDKAVKHVKKQFEDSLKSGKWSRSKLCLKIFCEFTNAHVLHVDTLAKLFKTLITYTVGLKSDSLFHESSLYMIVSSLPNCHQLLDSNPEDFDEILKFVYTYFEKRTVSHPKSFSFVKRDFLDSMWNQLQSIKEWKDVPIFKPYLKFEKLQTQTVQLIEYFDDFVMPSQESVLPYIRNRIGLRLDMDQKIEPMEEFILEENINDILSFYHKHVHDDCAQALVVLCSKQAQVSILIDTLFSNLFQITPEYTKLYYETILYDLTKFDKKCTMMIIKYIDSVFVLLDDLQIECYDRFIDFFAFLLCQVNYQWVWGNWATSLKSPDSVQYRFLLDLFDLLKRECHYSTLKHLTPHEFHDLIGTAPIPAEINSKDVITLSELLQDEKSAPQVEQSMQEGRFTSLQLFQSLLVAAKTFSHLMNILSRFQLLFVSKSQNKKEIMETVSYHWKHSTQWIQFYFEKLVEFKILSLTEVVEFLVSTVQEKNAKWIRDLVCLLLNKSQSKSDFVSCQNIFKHNNNTMMLTKMSMFEIKFNKL